MRVPMAHIRARHEPLRTGYEPLIRPIVVTCLGRSGTTWLMRMLRHHPEIVVYDKHPYEQTLREVLDAHAARALPARRLDQLLRARDLPQRDLGARLQPVLRPPDHARAAGAREWFGREYIERLARFCQSSIDGWYTTIAGAQGQDRRRPTSPRSTCGPTTSPC